MLNWVIRFKWRHSALQAIALLLLRRCPNTDSCAAQQRSSILCGTSRAATVGVRYEKGCDKEPHPPYIEKAGVRLVREKHDDEPRA
ncbi:hypothetical protein BOTBODRAFT_361848 [Botryobasidium botryosum FD-172 SS1]|uniref:Secreted protein n=1 Tax=Botryobasidium botryosum (strain FD-172 SS1) TaxID=930990 RepID=A0A067ME91_BOTB1|nr:hypothetical protein BOTBODRAFT_361848 [Botryobasidium botryosum FD-172 SS1]